MVPCVVDARLPAGGEDEGRLGELEDDRARGLAAGGGLAAQDRGLDPLAAEADRAGARVRARRRPPPPAAASGRGRPAPGRCRRGRPRRRGRGGRSAPRGPARSRRPDRPGRDRRSRDRQLEGLAGVAQLVDHLGVGASPGPPPISSPSAATSAAIRSAVKSAPLSITVRAVSRRRSEAQRPKAERTPPARGQRIVSIPSSAAIAAACIGPAPPNGSSAKPARVDAALDRDHPQRPHHLLVGDADDPGGGLQRVEAERAASPPTARSGRRGVERDPARQLRVGGEVAEQRGWRR